MNCLVFHRDFEDAYEERVRPVVGGTDTSTTTREGIQRRLDELFREDQKQVIKCFPDPATLDPEVIRVSDFSEAPMHPDVYPIPGPSVLSTATSTTYAAGPPGPTGPPTSKALGRLALLARSAPLRTEYEDPGGARTQPCSER